MFLMVCHFRTDLVSVQKKLSSIRTAWAICSIKVVIGLKKKLSVWTAWDMRSTVRMTEAICSKINFSRVSIPKPFRRYSHSCQTICHSPGHVRYEVCLQTHHIWIVMDLCSFVAIFAFILSIEYWHTVYSILKFFFFNKFPENNIFYLLHFCSLWASGTELHFPCMSRT